jgi:hypothetical protein
MLPSVNRPLPLVDDHGGSLGQLFKLLVDEIGQPRENAV